MPPLIRLVTSSSAERRRAALLDALAAIPAAAPVLVLGATRHAADDLARSFARERPATFGIHRASFTELVVRLALPELSSAGRLPASALGLEAVAARAAFEASRSGALRYFDAVAAMPGFRAALAATAHELRLADTPLHDLPSACEGGEDLRVLIDRITAHVEGAGAADRAEILRLASAALAEGRAVPLAGQPLLLLDVPVRTRLEGAFVEALARRASRMTITVPAGDDRTATRLRAISGAVVEDLDRDAPATALGRVQRHLFSTGDLPAGHALDARTEVEIFSAPGEARECVEIARRLLAHARAGVSFDRMAIVVRSPHQYAQPLESALARAGVPAWFARGTQRPDPSGRALLALLACRDEGLSARRFAEYLSLGQVPGVRPAAGGDAPATPQDEWLASSAAATEAIASSPVEKSPAPGDPAAHGTLRAPWKWEAMLVDAAVIGGEDRWRRRLDGLCRELDLRLATLRSEEPDSPRVEAVMRDREQLAHLRAFALPVIAQLHAWPASATWGEWSAAIAALVPSVLRSPARVLAVLADLTPMATVGPIPLREVREVLTERLSLLQQDPPGRPYGRVFVGSAEQVRGLAFDVVCVPGLVERVFPQRPRQDPLLLDVARRCLGDALARNEDRNADERAHLRIAAGAATRRLVFSYPSVDAASGRGRVPSFYMLDVARAVTGSVPDHTELDRVAREAGGARLAWPAPRDAGTAIDEAEFDLAVLREVFDSAAAAPASARGGARYLLALNPRLDRALRARYRRWDQKSFGMDDGFCAAAGDEQSRAMLAGFRLSARPYSPSALQRYAECPYQFFLASVHRLHARDLVAPMVRLDPRTRGNLFHHVQAEALRGWDALGLLPLSDDTIDRARAVLDETLDAVAEASRDDLAPPIERVWADEVAALRADLRGWMHRLAGDAAGWRPAYVELGLGFGPGEGRDAASVAADVRVDGGWRVHGIVDLVERRADRQLRVTDHKTGRNAHPRGLTVGGGRVLQPVLYALAVESALGHPVVESRLSFCTARGGHTQCTVPLQGSAGADARRAGVEVLEIIDRAVASGFLPAAPREGACEWCDFRVVCGPGEERRARRKAHRARDARIHDLDALRRMS